MRPTMDPQSKRSNTQKYGRGIVRLTVYVPKKMHRDLVAASRRCGVSQSRIVWNLIETWLAEVESDDRTRDR
jgi:hypothetical protein